MTVQPPLSVASANNMLNLLLKDADGNANVPSSDFYLVGCFSLFNHSFFDEDPPIVGEEPHEQICWKTLLTDGSGSLEVRVWGRACRDLFHVTSANLRQLWEEGVNDEEKQENILEKLNQPLASTWRLSCSAKVWVHTSKQGKARVQVNVNALELAD